MTVSDPVPLRADARRNLERILEAARLAFAEHGLDVGVEEIARRAGVGKATFFRRFPTKDALVLAVMRGFLDDGEAAAQRAAAAEDPWEGLRGFMIEHARMLAENAGFFDAVASRFKHGADYPEDLMNRSLAAYELALAPAREAGLVREGVVAADIGALIKMLGPAVRPMPGVIIDEATWTRYLDVLLAGIRAGQPALCGPAIDFCACAAQAAALRSA